MKSFQDVGKEGSSALEITTSYIWFSFLEALSHPIIEIDGEPHETRWGTHSFPVAPGKHMITAYHRSGVFDKAYESTISVEVPENQTVRLRWHTGLMTFNPGKWSEAYMNADKRVNKIAAPEIIIGTVLGLIGGYVVGALASRSTRHYILIGLLAAAVTFLTVWFVFAGIRQVMRDWK